MSETTKIQELIEAYDREINRYEERIQTLGNEFVDLPNKEFLEPDLREFLKNYPKVKADIDHFIRHRLVQLRTELHNHLVNALLNESTNLDNNLKRKKNDTELH